MPYLFSETVESWEDWGRVFQSVSAFEPLAREILRRESLPFSPLENLTPGTNAVFRSGGLVIKLFFPKESGLDPFPDFRNEAAVSARLFELGVPTPKLLAQGLFRDRYDFYYLVTEFLSGREAGDFLAVASPEQKCRFARRLSALLARLDQPAEGLIPGIDLRRRALENRRLDRLSPSLREDLRRRAMSLDLSDLVLVHGDLTGENLLVGPDESLTVIDCADACLAPAWYELGPIVFELFRCDPILLRAFAGDDRERFLQRVLDSVSLHDFGADLLRVAAEREKLPPFSRLEEVRAFLNSRLDG